MDSIIKKGECEEISMAALQACNCILIFHGLYHDVNIFHCTKYVFFLGLNCSR
jgi:hypothetical protein